MRRSHSQKHRFFENCLIFSRLLHNYTFSSLYPLSPNLPNFRVLFKHRGKVQSFSLLLTDRFSVFKLFACWLAPQDRDFGVLGLIWKRVFVIRSGVFLWLLVYGKKSTDLSGFCRGFPKTGIAAGILGFVWSNRRWGTAKRQVFCLNTPSQLRFGSSFFFFFYLGSENTFISCEKTDSLAPFRGLSYNFRFFLVELH